MTFVRIAEALQLPSKSSCILVEFSYGLTPTVIRLTDFTSSVVYRGQIYAPVPTMRVDIPKSTGGLDEEEFAVTLPLSPFTSAISIGEPFAPITMTVTELFRGAPDSAAHIHFVGDVTRAIRAYEGNPRQVRVLAVNVKSEFGAAMGFTSDTTCAWTLFGSGCGLTKVTQSGVITAIDRMTLTISGLTPPRDNYWARGYVEVDDLRLDVRFHNEAVSAGQVILVREPPRVWSGVTVTMTPGCLKDVPACRNDWANEEHFCGAGVAIPAYQPLLETR